jgi:hypothetical protein
MVFLVIVLHIGGDYSEHTTRPPQTRGAKEQSQDARDNEDPLKRLPPDSIYRLTVKDQLGDPYPLSQYAGKVTLVVNTACL